MDKSSNIDVRDLTIKAEYGQGHYVRSVLDQLPFEEQIHFAHQMENRSKTDNRLFGCPEIEFFTQDGPGDENSKNGYTNLKLYRKTPGHLGPLSDKEELLYENSLNLTTGNKTASDNDF